jgi:hypothetical protein
MTRALHTPVLTAFLAFALGASGRAQSSVPPPAEGAVFTDPNQAAAAADQAPAKPARPRRERVMSDELAATLAVGMPKYSPPKPVEKKPAVISEEAADDEKRKNGIIRLPDYVVREKRPPIFKERELATPERKADLAFKIHPGLGFGPLSTLNRRVGLAMYQEQERLDGMNELADDARTMRRAGDKSTADYITRQSQQTYIQRDDSWKAFGIGK